MVGGAGKSDWEDMVRSLGQEGQGDRSWRESLRSDIDAKCEASQTILPDGPSSDKEVLTYTLRNLRLKRNLKHPLVGLWFTTDLTEAKDMLESCLEYLAASGLSDMCNDFCIVNAVTNQPVVCSDSSCSPQRAAD